MDNQHQKELISSGDEGHVCQKCGFPFPIRNSSSRHRRAHKGICGTIEGYKLIEPVENPNLTVLDDEHHSDEDYKTPSPRGLQRSVNEMGSAALSERSNRSEDDVFADAVAEFSDNVVSPGMDEHFENARKSAAVERERIVEDNSDSSFAKVGAIADIIQQPSHLVTTEMNNPELLESTTDRLGGKEKSQDRGVIPGSKDDLIVSSMSDFEVQEVHVSLETATEASELNDIKPETLLDALQQNQKSDSGYSLTNFSLEATGEENTRNGNGNLGHNLQRPTDIAVLLSENVDNICEAVLKLEEANEQISFPTSISGVVQPVENKSDELDSMISPSDVSPELESVEQTGASTDTSEFKVDPLRGIDLTRHADTTEIGWDRKVEDDVPMGHHSEVMIEEFKGHERVKLNQPATLDICGINNERGQNVRYSLDFEENNFGLGTEISSPYVQDLEDNLKLKIGSSEPIVDELPVQVYAEVSQVTVMVDEKEGYDELGASSDTEVIALEKSPRSPGVDIEDNFNNVPKVNLEENITSSPVDEEVLNMSKATVGSYSVGNENARNEISDGADNSKVAEEVNCTDKAWTHAAASNASEPQVESKISLPESDGRGECGLQAVENLDIARVEGVEDSKEDIPIPIKIKEFPESSCTSNQICFEDANHGLVKKSTETECSNSDSRQVFLNRVYDIQQDRVQLEGNGHKQIQEENADGFVLVPEFFREDSESPRRTPESHKTSEDQMSKEQLLSSLESSNTAVDKNNARVIGDSASGTNYMIKQAEGDDNFVKPQHGASAVDWSIDSISQTDSLEGHWGSVSVLSTQSDLPALADAEALPSNTSQSSLEEKNDDTKISKAEEQHNKSKIFESPSFMTLVEPRDYGDGNDNDSDVEKVQNQPRPESAASQAGWFPSLTHVVNDYSQERKKNEEIITKVTNWSAGNPRAPLKSLLVEATSSQKQVVPKENPNPVIQKEETSTKDITPFAATVNSILGPESPPTNEPAKGNIAKEWNSPSRYPTEIKREKVKARPYWAQFMCCSSVK